MRKLIKRCVFMLAAMLAFVNCEAQDRQQKLQFSFSGGRQIEDFNWSIAGNISGQSPNVLSELKWKNVSGFGYSAALKWNFWGKLMFTGGYSRVSVSSGAVSDIDYTDDNRIQPDYNQDFSDNTGYTLTWFAGAGYPVINNKQFSLTPFAGYGFNRQSLYIIDLSGQFPDLNSSYNANWKGPFLEVKSLLKVWGQLKLAAGITYNQVTYSAQGNWNLITQFQHPVSYTHSAKGYGINASVGVIYNISANVAINAGYGYFKWETGNGTDRLYLSSGQIDQTQMNGVYRNGHSISGGIIFSY